MITLKAEQKHAFEQALGKTLNNLADKVAQELHPHTQTLVKDAFSNFEELFCLDNGWFFYSSAYCWCEKETCPWCTESWTLSAHDILRLKPHEKRLHALSEDGFVPLFALQSPEGDSLTATWYKHFGRGTTLKGNRPDVSPQTLLKRFEKAVNAKTAFAPCLQDTFLKRVSSLLTGTLLHANTTHRNTVDTSPQISVTGHNTSLNDLGILLHELTEARKALAREHQKTSQKAKRPARKR